MQRSIKVRARVPQDREVSMSDVTWGEYTPLAVGMNAAKLATIEGGINFAVVITEPFEPFFKDKRTPSPKDSGKDPKNRGGLL